MSIYKSSSLAMIPTAYKDGKLYSIRPTDGSGDFTFSRGSNLAATRTSASGYIEKGRENLLLQSNQFDTTWLDITLTKTSGQSGYDGTNDAWELECNAASSRLYQTSLSVSGVQTYSVYAKAGTLDYMGLIVAGAGAYAYFDIANGQLGATNVSTIDHKIESIGGGWYRCSIAYTGTTTAVRIYPAQADNDTAQTSGSIYIQDSQLESGLVSTSVISTTTTSVSAGILEDMPRLDYSGGASCPSLLLEPQRTNLITSSEALSIGTSGSTTEQNTADTTSPEGYYNATKILGSTSYLAKGVGSAFSGNNTTSVFLKYGNDSEIGVYMYDGAYYRVTFNIVNGTISSTFGGATGTITDYGNGWYRCSVSKSTPANVVEVGVDGVVGYVYTYGWQHEYNASYPTSYIPTYGTSQTRSADSCLATSVSDVIGQTQGTIFIEVGEVHNNSDTGSTKWFMEIRKDQNNSFGFGSGGADSAPTIRFVTNIAGSVSTDAEPAGFSNSKIAIRYTAEDFKIYQNGVLQSTIAKSIGGYVDIQFMEGAGDDLSMPIKQFSAFPTALTDSECIALTSI